ncbi:hypothetical protein SAMN02745163_00778 [Clostridium cavendishii DSM 21758]|uniref:Uncharacterized protein n=1 Tax=Clostridium cavendishii DSM 21758 TaxID=1121302 RepID=A0A1M6E7V3_9CLOT|nr:hypothetical protein [Clostridium cavendishii]SHI81430.1 hypothetical protein SAMN02745163_00778 [Clostridium cavendishii DSM 21758]
MAEVKLSPPWYTFANEIKYTYGLSPYIKVSNLAQVDDEYLLNIFVSSDKIAHALRAILPLIKTFGNIKVIILIYDEKNNIVQPEDISYTPEILATTFCTALYKNPLFKGAVLISDDATPPIGNVVLVIAKEIVQFYNDDISDLCRNFNEVAAKVFTDVTTLAYTPNLTVSFSTYDCDCRLQKDIFCPKDKCSCHPND